MQEVTDLNNIPKAKYAYLADGTKLGVKDRMSRNGYEYYGSFRYSVVNGQKKLESVPYEGGRIVVSSSGSGASLSYAYNINAYTTDQLLSTRGAKYNVSDSAYEDYYSFGKGWENPAYSSNFDKYTYNGKEMQTTGWLPYLDYGARMYDPRIGRWFGQDPLAEKYYSTSPYAFCANNPINFVDPDGLRRVAGGNRRDTKDIEVDADAILIIAHPKDWTLEWMRYTTVQSNIMTSLNSERNSNMGGGGSSSPVPTFFAERLLLHYMSRKGTDYKLTKEEFNYLVEKGKPICDEWASEAPDLHKVIVSYYGVDFDLEHGFGTASIFYTDMNGFLNPTHFRDYYNFDHKKAGDRDPSAERKTHWGSYIPGVGFWIKYP